MLRGSLRQQMCQIAALVCRLLALLLSLVIRRRAELSAVRNLSFARQDHFHSRLSRDRSRYSCGFAVHLARPTHSILPFALLLLTLRRVGLKSLLTRQREETRFSNHVVLALVDMGSLRGMHFLEPVSVPLFESLFPSL
jgi:hypothetical protein